LRGDHGDGDRVHYLLQVDGTQCDPVLATPLRRRCDAGRNDVTAAEAHVDGTRLAAGRIAALEANGTHPVAFDPARSTDRSLGVVEDARKPGCREGALDRICAAPERGIELRGGNRQAE